MTENEQSTLARLRQRARRGFESTRNRVAESEVPRRVQEGSRRGAEFAKRVARESGARVREVDRQSPSERAGQQATMGAPLNARLDPADDPQRLQDLATARPSMAQRERQPQGSDGGDQAAQRQPDPLVGFGGFGPGPDDQPRVDDLVTGGGRRAQDGQQRDKQQQPEPMFSYGFEGDGDEGDDGQAVDPLLDFGQSDDENGGGLL